jgi:hypothetical protein
MKRLLAILAVIALAIGIAGFNSNPANAGAAACGPRASLAIDQVLAEIEPAALTERPGTSSKPARPDGYELACNLACARQCNARFANCYDRACRDQRSACVRSCGC